MKKIFTFCLLLCLIAKTSTLVRAQPVISIHNEREQTSIGKSISIYVDKSSLLSIHDIVKPDFQNQFKQSEQDILNIGITNASLWCKLKVENTTHLDNYLKLANIHLDSITIYEVISQDSFLIKQGGNYVNFRDRDVRNNNNIFKLTGTTDGVKEFYLRVRHSRGTQFPLYIGTMTGFAEVQHIYDFIQGIYFGFMLLMIFYNLFIYFSVRDSSYIYYVIYGACITLLNASLTGYSFEYFWPNNAHINKFEDVIAATLAISGILFAINFLHTKQNAPLMHKIFQIFIGVFVLNILIVFNGNLMLGTLIVEIFSLVLIVTFFITAFMLLKKGYKPAKYFLYAWSALLIGVFIFVLKDFDIIPYNTLTVYSLQIGSAFEALLLSFALADRINIYKKEKDDAQEEMLKSLREKETLILNQNQLLETKVSERTNQLNQSLENLKSTQSQLIQSEKMASLGELTAGIAHEIQNPLNFVNNFSEVSKELLDEMNDELEKGNLEDVRNIMKDVIQNLEKINHHGKRADGIVKGMLQHSSSSSGTKEPTDINALADEYLRLAYHGLRAKDKSFNATMNTDFDETIGKVSIIPQNMSRVILNLITNAFYAVHERKNLLDLAKQKGDDNLKDFNYQPTVTISTQLIANSQLLIAVKDNGNGIPQKVLDKIFQPFFTTKPTGQGTGLGLSLAYDIVTKGHGGELKVETKEGEGSTFIISLPIV